MFRGDKKKYTPLYGKIKDQEDDKLGKLLKDLNKVGMDGLKTAVSPVSGPLEQLWEDGKDAAGVAKDIWDFGNKHTTTSEDAIDSANNSFLNKLKVKQGTKRKGDPLPDPREGKVQIQGPGPEYPPGIDGSNARNAANEALINKMSKGGADAEVPVAAVPRAISKIHPDHFNIRLPFVRTMTFASNKAEFTNILPVCYIRLNSIYDVLKNSVDGRYYPVHFDDATATAGYAGIGATDTTANKIANPIATSATQTQTATYDEDVGPQGRNIWQAHFKYYRVLQSHVKLTFLNKNCDQIGQSYTGTEEASTISATPGDINVFRNSYACGFELIDEDGQVSNNCSMFLMTKNAERTILPAAKLADISFSSAANAHCISQAPNVTTMTYAYNPSNWNYHVEQQGSSETRWTAVGANPSLDHLLAVRMFHMDSNSQNYPTYQNLGVMIQVEYEVQFMECLDSFYKTQYYQASADS